MGNQDSSTNTARFHAGMLAIIGRSHSAIAENHLVSSAARKKPGVEPSGPDAMMVFSPKGSVDTSHFQSFGPPGALGGQVLAGDPQLSGRIDLMQGNVTAGLFMATTGTVRITFPFSEHSTILDGEVTLTDEAGQTRTLKPGDCYVVRQGQVIIWDVKGKQVIKSFFNVVDPTL